MLRHRLLRISVFTVAAFIVFVAHVLASSGAIGAYYVGSLQVFSNGSTAKLHLPGFQWLVVAAYITIAARLYVHAWAVDESATITNGLAAAPLWIRALEYCLRLTWIVGTTFISYLFTRTQEGKISATGVQVCLALILLSLAVWDQVVWGSLPAQIRETVQSYLLPRAFDALLCLLFLLGWALTTIPIGSEADNWFLLAKPFVLFLIAAIAIVQLIEFSAHLSERKV